MKMVIQIVICLIFCLEIIDFIAFIYVVITMPLNKVQKITDFTCLLRVIIE